MEKVHWLKEARTKQKGKKVCINCKHFGTETNDWESSTTWEAIICEKNESISENENWKYKTHYYRCFEQSKWVSSHY